MAEQDSDKEKKIADLLLDDIEKSNLEIIRDSSNSNYGRTTRSIAIENYVHFIEATR